MTHSRVTVCLMVGKKKNTKQRTSNGADDKTRRDQCRHKNWVTIHRKSDKTPAKSHKGLINLNLNLTYFFLLTL